MTAQRKKLLWRFFWVALLVLVVAAAAAPFLSAERFAPRIRAALATSLGREVEFREPRFSLFRGPGFSVKDVVIHEDPSFGSEPVAYVRTLNARIDLGSLLSGRLAFSNLRMVEPSVNLCRNQAGQWNSQLLFRGVRQGGVGAPWPTIQVRGGRVNWKFGEWKSVYYFSDADMDLYVNPASDGSIVLRFTGVPARTDRASQSFGAMRGRLRWLPVPGDGRLEAEVELERSSLGELVMLAHGEDVGVHGAVSGNMRLSGPSDAVEIAGQLNIESLYRWDLAPAKTAGVPLSFRGVFDATGQRLELDVNRLDNPNLGMELRLRVADILTAPRWAASLTASDMPLRPVVETIEHLGSPVSKELVTDGKMTGAVVYSPESGFRGQLKLDAVKLQLPGKAAAQMEQAHVIARGDSFEMPASTLRFDNSAAAVEWNYHRLERALNVRFSARALPTAALKSALGATVPPPMSKLVEATREGICSGTLQLSQAGDKPGEWSAETDVRGATFASVALSKPVRVSSAHVSLAGAKFTVSAIDARVQGISAGGEISFHPGMQRPYRLHLSTPDLDAGALEALLAPALQPKPGFLQRTLHIGHPAPPHWLDDWRAEGVIEAGTLTVNGLEFKKARAGFTWDGAELAMKPVSAAFENGALAGALAISVSGAAPRYRFSGRVENMHWRAGKVAIEGVAEASGAGEALLKSLRMKGTLRGESLDLLADKEVRSLEARGEVDWRGGAPEYHFTDLLVRFPRENVKGSGGTAKAGTLEFTLNGESARYHVRGAASPLKLELTPER